MESHAHTPHRLPFLEAQRSDLAPWMVTNALTYSHLLTFASLTCQPCSALLTSRLLRPL